MEKLKISVITICFNAVSYIERTLTSVHSQTYENLEHVVIDGASTDGTLDILKLHSSGISKLVSEPDSGIYNAMNKGVTNSTGDYLIFLNGGDVFHDPEALSRLIEHSSGEKIVYGDLVFRETTGDVYVKSPSPLTTASFLQRSGLYHPSTMYSRCLFLDFGGYDESYKIVGDFEFNLRVGLREDIEKRHVDTLVSIFYRDGVSSRPEANSLRLRERRMALINHFGFLKYRVLKTKIWLKRRYRKLYR